MSGRLSRTRRTLFTLATVATVAFAATSVAVTPAQAATPDPILLSPDGVIWDTGLPGGLFDAFQGAVPGDTATRTFWIKNPLSTPITLKIRALGVWVSNSQLDDSITVSGMASGLALAAPVTLASLAECAALAPDTTVAGNATSEVTITIAMLDVAGHVAQQSTGGFDVLLSMQQSVGAPSATPCDSGPSSGLANTAGAGSNRPSGLAFTGIDPSISITAAALFIGVGLFFVIARRRRERDQ